MCVCVFCKNLFHRRTLTLAIELGERAVEAQACYSLGNTYTLLRDFPVAIEYHQRHLTIAQELGDKVGEARACWSLGNAHSSIGNHERALTFAQQHYNLAKDVSVEIILLNFCCCFGFRLVFHKFPAHYGWPLM